MPTPEVVPDPVPAGRNENRADEIKRRVDRGKIGYCHVERSRNISHYKRMARVLEPPKPAVTAQDQQSTFAHRLAVSAIRFVVVIAVSALLGGGWYLAKKGFGRHWRNQITQELRKHGVEARIRRLTLDPFRGLVARDVRIFDYKKRENTLAVISEIALDINYAALIHHEPFLNEIDVRNAQATLQLPGVERKV